MVPAMLALGRSNFFLHHGASIWVQANDSIFDMHDRPCDILLFGDSTAMTGLDPAQIARATGLRTCNIAVTNAVLAVLDTAPLNHFLSHNPTPRVLLFQFSPDDLQLEAHTWTRTVYAEGILELLRHGSPADIRSTLLHHPRETLAFSGYVAGFTAWFALRSAWAHLSGSPVEEHRIHIRDGFFTPPLPPITACEPAGHHTNPADRQFPADLIQTLRRRYATPATTVLIDVAPIPSCDENLPAYTAQLQQLTSNQPVGLPIHLFNDQRHYTAAGARLVSAAAARQILATLADAAHPVQAPPATAHP